jgi:hypothetical protein
MIRCKDDGEDDDGSDQDFGESVEHREIPLVLPIVEFPAAKLRAWRNSRRALASLRATH